MGMICESEGEPDDGGGQAAESGSEMLRRADLI